MGFSLRRMFRNPFGKHSVFAKATQIASILPIPFGGLVGKAFALANRGKATYDRIRGAVGPVLTAHQALTAGDAPIGVMPGGARVGAPRARSPGKRARARSSAPRAARRKGRKLKFGSPAWRAKYMKRRR